MGFSQQFTIEASKTQVKTRAEAHATMLRLWSSQDDRFAHRFKSLVDSSCKGGLKGRSGGKSMSTTVKLFGDGRDVQSFKATAKADFDLMILLLDGDERRFRSQDLQAFIDQIFGICRNGPNLEELFPFDGRVGKVTVAIELHATERPAAEMHFGQRPLLVKLAIDRRR